MVFLKKKNLPQTKKIFFCLFSMQLFSADAIVFSKKINFFFDPEKVKKRASKDAYNRPGPFYFTVQPRPTAHSPELILHIMKSRDQTSVLLSVLRGQRSSSSSLSLDMAAKKIDLIGPHDIDIFIIKTTDYRRPMKA